MTEQANEFEFGDYAIIEQKRFGVPNELFTHKVISTLRSNTWVDVPVKTPRKEVIHDEIEEICLCICCGVDETEVHRYRAKDMQKSKFSNDKSLRISHLEKLADDAGKTLTFQQSRIDTLTAERDQLIEKNNRLVAENEVVLALMKEQSECFSAAISEGFHEAVMQCGIEHLIDVYQRRLQPAIQCIPPTINTDAAISAIRAEGRKEGAIFAANRMLAAWDAGFVEDTPENAADIARAILSMTDFMDDAPEGDFNRSFADEILEAIAAQLRQSVQVKGVQS